MQLVIRIEDGQPVGEPLTAGNLRLLHPDVPEGHLFAADIEGLGFAPFFQTARPENRNLAKRVLQATPTEKSADGEWLQRWEIVNRDDISEEDREAFQAQFEAAQAQAVQMELSEAVQNHLDATARARGYDDIRSAVTYAEEPAVPAFQAEGQAFRAWRSQVWAYCYQLLDAVFSGTRPVPTTEELIAELPELVLP